MPAPMNEYIERIALTARRYGGNYVQFFELHNLSVAMSCAHPNVTGLQSWGVELASRLGMSMEEVHEKIIKE